MNWQPIETVPNDGRMVFFYVPGKPWPIMNRADDYRGGGYWLEDATHWMPLPEPPEDA